MRPITHIVVHCSASREGLNYSAADIDKWHKTRGFKMIGYHYVVKLDGAIEHGRPEQVIGAHVEGHNLGSIGICYIGGLDADGKPKDTRTNSQRQALESLLRDLRSRYPKAQILGHRDFSPDTNGDGVIEKFEWMKACPSFDAKTEYIDLK